MISTPFQTSCKVENPKVLLQAARLEHLPWD